MNCKIKYFILLAVSFTLMSCASFEIPTILESKDEPVSSTPINITSNASEDSTSENISTVISNLTDTNSISSSNQISSNITPSYTPKEITIRFVYKEVIKENSNYIYKNVIDDSLQYTFLDQHIITDEEYNSIYVAAQNSLQDKLNSNYRFVGFDGLNTKFTAGFVVNDSDIEFSYGFYSLVNYNTSYKKELTEKELSLNAINYDNIGTYSTGNYSDRYDNSDINIINNCTFEHYRGINTSNGFIKLLPFFNSKNDNTIGGSLYNITAIKEITHISVTYLTDLEDESITFKLSVGKNTNQEKDYILNSSKSFITAEIDVENVSFLKFYTDALEISIESIDIFYKGSITTNKMAYQTEDNESFRINPIAYNGKLIDGISKVEMPISVEKSGNNSYIVKETKLYTYYSSTYVKSHPEVVNDAAMTEPMDIINYYLAFREYPANFVKNIKDYLKTNTSVFGNKLRQANEYYREDGYVNAVPYNKGNISYIEFDVDIDNTYFISSRNVSRGVGRVIIFKTGFINDGYDSSPVGIFTDDHYSTFFEYYNNGIFSKRFNAQSRQTINEYLNVVTLS